MAVSREILRKALAVTQDLVVMWSGGKDSTAMTHLICVDLGLQLPVYAQKDDMDYPGEVEYIEGLSQAWGLNLSVLRPSTTIEAWIREHAHGMLSNDDLHSRSSPLAKKFFYDLVESSTKNHAGIFLGLRSEESRGRRLNRASRGPLYQKANGQWVCTPIVDWSGLDVMAYLFSRGIDLLPVYRCIGFDPTHRIEPWRVRKSWWLPGTHASFGGVSWLRHYWPSLYRKLRSMLPDASRHT